VPALVRYIAEDGEGQLTIHDDPPRAYLVLLVNSRIGQSFPLRTEITLGRDKSNTVVIADQKVSRHHATLSPAEETFVVIDQGSANGTYLNGVLISQPNPLKDKDRLSIGDTNFLFTTSKPDFDAIIPLLAPSASRSLSRLMSSNPSIINVEQNNKALWILVICLGLIIVLLLLMLTTVLGILIGRGQPLGLLFLIFL
jgi:pSer/pThr/pTyr-binding forkhead associated (FHA) protein